MFKEMMVERNAFRIRFGKMNEAKAIWMEIVYLLKSDMHTKIRLLTDLTGPAYTLILESELKDFLDLGLQQEKWKSNHRVMDLYRNFMEVCESSERILYHLEYQN